MRPMRYFLVPEGAAWPAGVDVVEDIIGRERPVNLSDLAAWEVSPTDATAFLDGAGPIELPPPPARGDEPEPDLSALLPTLTQIAGDPDAALALVARLLDAARTEPPASVWTRFRRTFFGSSHAAYED